MSNERERDDGLGTAPVALRTESRHLNLPVYDLPARLGRYLLLERIGVGGMAEVFVAQQDGPAGFQKRVVVKRILPHLAEDAHFVEMFQREARLAASLNHSNVVQVYELASEGNAHFIAMELVEGLTVHRLARRAWRARKSLPLEVACSIIADAALGLHHAHELSLVHRDVSPENLMVSNEGITKVLDFGIARSTTSAATLTKTGELKGKLPFLSPEAIRGDVVDGRTDLYALGVTMYWLLTGQRPITARSEVMLLHAALTMIPKPPSSINPSVPLGIDHLVCALLEKDPNNRPSSGREIYDALAEDLPPRSVIAAPFVREVAALSDVEPGFEVSTGDGFIPSSPQTSRVISGWGSAPTSSSLRSTSAPDQGVQQRPRRRAIAMGAAGAAVLGVVVTIALTVARREEPPEAPALPPGAAAASALPGATPSPAALPSPVDPTSAPGAPTSAPATSPEPPVEARATNLPTDEKKETEPRATAPARLRKVELRGPPGIKWSTTRGKALGAGNVSAEIPADQKSVVAVDARRGVRSTLSIGSGSVDYANAPRGKLDLRAFPYAEVFLGGESLGVTPLQPVAVVAGTYSVRFVYKEKEQKRTVALGGGKTERVIVDFR